MEQGRTCSIIIPFNIFNNTTGSKIDPKETKKESKGTQEKDTQLCNSTNKNKTSTDRPGISRWSGRKASVSTQHSWAVASYLLVSEKYDIVRFIEEHDKDLMYLDKLQDLQVRYYAVRATCADGSCFYRGLAYAYLEILLGKSEELKGFRERVSHSRDELLAAGFTEDRFKQNYDTFISLIDESEKDGLVDNLLRSFNQPEISDSVVQYLRLVTSAQVRKRGDFYMPFIDEEQTIEDFCVQNVEPMVALCDHVQISALTQALTIPLIVEYVDSLDKDVIQHVFSQGASQSVYMLYEQNHYTVLYKREQV
ncbi:ubiquitin thioesterase OTUB2 [Leptodactylus fuscus]|uniref:ubiquitin thioesterase OTUB2 n=1 Tax=Leptodactylus fuscus TaxID=238119 RepID=UPI003F4EF13B